MTGTVIVSHHLVLPMGKILLTALVQLGPLRSLNKYIYLFVLFLAWNL